MDVTSLRHILAAIDDSPHAQAASAQAVQLARRHKATLTFLHVAIPATPRNPMSRAEALRVAHLAEATGQRLLVEAQLRAASPGCCRTELHVGPPAELICRRARELSVDLIVVGSRGLGLLDRLFLGSVSAAVTQRAHCSVLIVRQPPHEDSPSTGHFVPEMATQAIRH